MPPKKLKGTEITSAQGQETIRKVRALYIQTEGAPPKNSGTTASRGVNQGETADEGLAARFIPGGVLHQVQDTAGGRFPEGLGDADPQKPRKVHTSGYYCISLSDVAGDALAREGRGIQRRCPFYDYAVQRDTSSGPDDHDIPGGDIRGIDRLHPFRRFQEGGIRPYVHKGCNASPAAAFGDSFKEFSELKEKHYEHGLRELRAGSRQESDGQGSDRSHSHQKIFVQGLSFQELFRPFAKGFPSDCQIGYKIKQEKLPFVQRRTESFHGYASCEHQRRRNYLYKRFARFLFHIPGVFCKDMASRRTARPQSQTIMTIWR